MKLSKLVAYRNQLAALSIDSAKTFTNLELGKFTHLVDDPTLNQDLEDINTAFNTFNNTVTRLKQELKSAIEEAEKPWFQESYRLHEEEIWQHPPEHIFNMCVPNTSIQLKDIVETRLNLYARWHYAGMVIRPGKETFVNQLVSFDPLYVLDQSYELLSPCVGQFSTAYQRRLRQYTINDLTHDEILKKIPDGQFAFCVVYMYFNYKPLEVIKQYFAELYQKLKPGGVLAFTFNDCDWPEAVELVEQHFCCYTPGYLVKDLAESIGFEIKFEWHEKNYPNTWIELQKPGTLSSLKGGQTLAKILPKQL